MNILPVEDTFTISWHWKSASVVWKVTSRKRNKKVSCWFSQWAMWLYYWPFMLHFLYSWLSLNGNLELVPAFLYSLNLTLYKTDISQRQTFSTSREGVHLTGCRTHQARWLITVNGSPRSLVNTFGVTAVYFQRQ